MVGVAGQRMDGLMQREADRCAERARDPRAEGLSALIAIETLRTQPWLREVGERHLAVRQEWSAPLVAELRGQSVPGTSPRHAAVAKAMDYMRVGTASPAFDDGRICRTNNAAERALRGRSWLFCGSDRRRSQRVDWPSAPTFVPIHIPATVDTPGDVPPRGPNLANRRQQALAA